MSDSVVQIYEPEVGHSYRVHSKGTVFVARVTTTDEDTVTVVPIGHKRVTGLKLKRLETKFEEWL